MAQFYRDTEAYRAEVSDSNRQAFYGSALAAIHDLHYSAIATGAAREVLSRIGPSSDPARPGLIADLGCGGGALLASLHDAGHRVWGVDLSADFVARCRHRIPSGEFTVGSIFDVTPPASQAITCTGEVINYTADPSSGPNTVAELFSRVATALEPGGLFLLDSLGPDVQPPDEPRTRSMGGDQWHISATSTLVGDILTRRIKLTTNDPEAVVECWDLTEEVHEQRLYSPALIAALLDSVGFDVAVLNSYGDTEFRPGHTGFAATRQNS